MDILPLLSLNPYKKRVELIDVARALSMCIIVYAHIYDSALISRFVHLFHVPIFFYLSGLVWKRKDKSIRIQLADGFRKLLIPYYICALLSIVCYMIFGRFVSGNSKTLSLMHCIGGALYANSRSGLMVWNRPLWFIPCLFSVRIIWEIISIYLKDEKKRSIAVASIFAVGMVISYRLTSLILPYEIEIALVMLGYYYLGTKSRELITKLEKTKNHYLGSVLIIALGICLFVFRFNQNVTVQYNRYGNIILFLIGSFAGITMVLTASKWIARVKTIQFVGQNTLPILLWHKFPVLLFQISPIGKKVMENPDSIGSFMIGICVVIITVTLCLLVAYCCKRINELKQRAAS